MVTIIYLSTILQMILELQSKEKTQPGWITVQLKIYKQVPQLNSGQWVKDCKSCMASRMSVTLLMLQSLKVK